ncbi:MAG: hypothetical protein H3C58_10565, partial [Fimbriimonadaceae bacterium]|nr:hypothetical protein [Fimbriimonadaceae bacterium]
MSLRPTREAPVNRQGAVSPVCVAYQSGPVAEVLMAMDQQGITGTIYVYAPVAVDMVRLLRSAVLAGHEIGNAALVHLTDEDGLLMTDDPNVLKREIAETEEFIANVLQDKRNHSIALSLVPDSRGPERVLDQIAQALNLLAMEELKDWGPRTWLIGSHGLNVPPINRRSVYSWSLRDGDGVVRQAIQARAWAVPRFDPPMQTASETTLDGFAEMCRLAAEARDRVWVGSVHQAAVALTKGNLVL